MELFSVHFCNSKQTRPVLGRMFFWLVLLLLFSSCSCQEKEKIKSKVKVGRIDFQCAFTIVWVGSELNLKKSKLVCNPKKKKAKTTKFSLTSSKGILFMDFTINPSKITKAVLDLPSPHTSTTTTTPPLPGSTNNCPLGFAEVCTLPSRESCPEGSELSCPNIPLYVNNIPTNSDCTCISTYVVDEAVLSGKSPLGFCYDACVCLPSSVTSCSQGAPSCSQPQAPETGEWFCTEEINGLTCTLECDIGYISGPVETTVCNGGHWTMNPTGMTCQAAVALITYEDNAQIYSPYGLCSQMLPSPPKRRAGTLDYVGQGALLCGGFPGPYENEKVSPICMHMNLTTYTWSNHSNPPLSNYVRDNDGVLLTRHHHSSLVHQNSLMLMGGQGYVKDTYEVGNGKEWKSFNTTPFNWIYGSERCTVKVSRDTYIIMGGWYNKYFHDEVVKNRVLEYNITSQTFKTLPELQMSRSYHACSLVENSTFKGILLPGSPSELYDLRTQTSEIVGSLNTIQGGQLMVLGEKIVLMGTTNVEEFDLATQTWSIGQYNLLSSIGAYSQATAIPGPADMCCDCYA